MMKYALGTIFGTTLLGLAKSKMGSGIRLTFGEKEFIEMKFTYDLVFWTGEGTDFENEEEGEWTYLADNLVDDAISKILNTQRTLANGAYIDDIHSIESFEASVAIEVYVDIKRTGNNDTNPIETTDFYCQRLIDAELPATTIRHITSPVSEVKKRRVIVNADTGEEYNIPKSRTSKLRKR